MNSLMCMITHYDGDSCGIWYYLKNYWWLYEISIPIDQRGKEIKLIHWMNMGWIMWMIAHYGGDCCEILYFKKYWWPNEISIPMNERIKEIKLRLKLLSTVSEDEYHAATK